MAVSYYALCFLVLIALAGSGCTPAADVDSSDREAPRPVPTPEETVPAWAADAVFYQVFPERFRNADPGNDPPREMLERPYDDVPESWQVRPWTSDWYARTGWEEEMSEDFYEAVFERRYGGDLQGVINELPYLDSLGVNALYFNPLFWARSLHKYDGNTFHHIDPHFGPDPEGDFELMEQEDPTDPNTWVWTAADRLFLDLVQEAHSRDIRIIIDGVFNHTGRDFFAFADLEERQQASEFRDWYIVHSFRDPDDPERTFEYEAWWGIETLPEFAENEDGTDLHSGPKEYIFNITERWMQPVVDGHERPGVDGWRLDVTQEVPIGFWQDWNAYVRELNPEAYTVAEVWEPAAEYVVEGGFSAAMNYYAFAYPVKGYLIDSAIGPSEFAELLNERREAFPPPYQYALLNLIDSHDTERLASMIVNRGRASYPAPERFGFDRHGHSSPRQDPDYDVSKPGPVDRKIQHLVALFQMTYVGAPMIYYGTEAGMWGADDPDDRKPMLWPDLDYEPETEDPLGRERTADEVSFDHDLYQFYRELIHLRHQYAPLRRGSFEVLFASEEQNIFAFERKLEGTSVVVVLSRSDEAHSMRIPVGEGGPYEMVFLTRDDAHRVQQDATALLLELPERAGMVLVREE